MKIFRIVFYLVVLTGLAIYGKVNNPAVTLAMCLEDPVNYDGTTLSLGAHITVKELVDDGFIMQQFGREILVRGSSAGIAPHDFISIIAVFHKEGWLELNDVHVAQDRRYKILVSLFPAVLVIVFFFKTFSFNWKQMQFIERS